MSKQFLDLTANERLRYMRKPYLEQTKKNISRQQESLEMVKKLREGEVEEEEFDFNSKILSIEKNLRSNMSYMRQLISYFDDPGAGQRKTIKLPDRSSFISFSSKINYQFESIINNLEDILDNIKLYPSAVDYSQFNKMYKSYNNFLNIYNTAFKPFFVRAHGQPNLVGDINTLPLMGYMQRLIDNINKIIEYFDNIKIYAQNYGIDKGKIGLGKIPKKYL